jgi:hypothetical protein
MKPDLYQSDELGRSCEQNDTRTYSQHVDQGHIVEGRIRIETGSVRPFIGTEKYC